MVRVVSHENDITVAAVICGIVFLVAQPLPSCRPVCSRQKGDCSCERVNNTCTLYTTQPAYVYHWTHQYMLPMRTVMRMGNELQNICMLTAYIAYIFIYNK